MQPQADDKLVIPAAVRAAAQASEELHRQFYPKEPPPAEAQTEQTPAEGTTEEAAPQPEATPQGSEAPAAPTPPAPTPPPAQPDDQSWEHRYKSMKGRYDADTRRLSERIAHLESTISTMQTAPPPAQPEPEQTRLITPEEENDYGVEFLKTVGKKAREELNPEVAALKKQIADLEAKVKGTAQMTADQSRRQMFDTLTEQVPNWGELNGSQQFLDWLRLPEPYSGVIRQVLLDHAVEQCDTPRVLAFFKGFLADEAATRPVTARQPDQAAAPKVPLESLAAPGRAKAAASTPAEKPYITTSQIEQFYADATAGRYAGRDKERIAAEQAIWSAQMEGRIVQG